MTLLTAELAQSIIDDGCGLMMSKQQEDAIRAIASGQHIVIVAVRRPPTLPIASNDSEPGHTRPA